MKRMRTKSAKVNLRSRQCVPPTHSQVKILDRSVLLIIMQVMSEYVRIHIVYSKQVIMNNFELLSVKPNKVLQGFLYNH